LASVLEERVALVLRSAWRRLGGTAAERAVGSATVLCVLLGLWLRARGFLFDPTAFWTDECSWAMYTMTAPLRELVIRPIGFMAISKTLAVLFGPTETVLRALPWLAGVSLTLLLPALSRRLFTAPAARLLFVAVVALHPAAQSFTKEFKPYGISLSLHLLLVFLTLRYASSGTRKDLAWLLGVAAIGILFAQDLVFAYPGVFLIAGYEARRSRSHLVAVGATALLIVLSLVVQYVLFWSQLTSTDTDTFGDKYDVFYSSSAGSYLGWLFERYGGIAAFPGLQRKFWNARWLPQSEWDALGEAVAVIWVVLHAIGLVVLARFRRAREALLLVLPLLVLLAFNAVGRWPFGVFRTNLFLVGNTAAIAAMAFDWPVDARRRLSTLLPAFLLVIVPLFAFEKDLGPQKRALTYSSQFPSIVRWLAARSPAAGKPKEIVVVGRGSCDPWFYYVYFHPETSSAYREAIERGFDVRCIRDRELLGKAVLDATASSTRPTWLVSGDRTPREGLRSLAVVARTHVDRHVAVGFTRRREP
jgi:hypothetical protein